MPKKLRGIDVVLKISVIAEIVGAFLSVEDLKSCRKISTNWNKWFGSTLRKKATFHIRNLNDLTKLVLHPDDEYTESPHKRFTFKFKMMEGVKLQRSLNTFWEVHGAGLTSLTISGVENCSWEMFLDMLYRQTPNMKTLVIDDSLNNETVAKLRNEFMSPTSPRFMQTKLTRLQFQNPFDPYVTDDTRVEFLSWIIRLYPNVQALSLHGYFCHESSAGPTDSTMQTYNHLEKVFTSLVDIRRNDSNMFSVKRLCICGASAAEEPNIGTPLLQILQTVQFPLESLTIDVGIKITDGVFEGILEMCKGTLTKLAAYRTYCLTESRGNFPFGIELNKLKVLRLSQRLLQSFEFFRLTPNLETLHICGTKEKIQFINEEGRYWYLTDALKENDARQANGIKLKSLKEARLELDEDDQLTGLHILASLMDNFDEFAGSPTFHRMYQGQR